MKPFLIGVFTCIKNLTPKINSLKVDLFEKDMICIAHLITMLKNCANLNSLLGGNRNANT